MQTLGEKIRELRQARDLSLREFASRVKVTPGFMSDVELGRRHPSDEKLEAIGRVLNMPMHELKNFDTPTSVAGDSRRGDIRSCIWSCVSTFGG